MEVPVGLTVGAELTKETLFNSIKRLMTDVNESDDPDEVLRKYTDTLVDEIVGLIKTSIVTTTGTAATQTGNLT